MVSTVLVCGIRRRSRRSRSSWSARADRRPSRPNATYLDNLRDTKLPLNNRSGAIPALGFSTLIPDPVATRNATKAALEVGFRALDTSERYRTEKVVGEAMQEVFNAGKVKREDVFLRHEAFGSTITARSAFDRPSKPA